REAITRFHITKAGTVNGTRTARIPTEVFGLKENGKSAPFRLVTRTAQMRSRCIAWAPVTVVVFVANG
ncbi:MAG: hypothetical protein ACI4QH_01785, partial [Candidatus Fimimonas sp.]